MTQLDIKDIEQQLHAEIHKRLFGTGPWLQDRETNVALHKQLLVWGLIQYGDVGFSNTGLGRQLDLDLLECFLGHRDEYEIPDVLNECGLISTAEADDLLFVRFEQNGEKPEDVLPPILRHLYLERFGTA